MLKIMKNSLFTENLRQKLFLYIQFVDRIGNMLFIFFRKVRVNIHSCRSIFVTKQILYVFDICTVLFIVQQSGEGMSETMRRYFPQCVIVIDYFNPRIRRSMLVEVTIVLMKDKVISFIVDRFFLIFL